MVHSYIYYELNQNLVPDDTWQQWANQLVALQQDNPTPIGFFDDLFNGFDGSTGFHLTKNDWARATATRLLWHNQFVR
jgi:hypothetical protein